MAILQSTRSMAALAAGPLSEADLLKRRDAEAWRTLFERDHALVYRFVLSSVGERAVADDIAGQVFLEALEGIGRYRDRGKPVTAWLLAIARHRTLDWFRRRARESADEFEPVAPCPGDRLDDALDALALLTDDQRAVIHLRYIEGFSLDEVADLTGRRVGAVKGLQHRALGRLRTILREERSQEI